MRGSRKTFIILGVLFLISGFFSLSEGAVDRIVAIVNQEIITLSEVEKLICPLMAEIKEGSPLERRGRIHELSRMALERLIEEKLIDQEAKKSGIKVVAKEVEGAIEEIKRRNSMAPSTSLATTLIPDLLAS